MSRYIVLTSLAATLAAASSGLTAEMPGGLWRTESRQVGRQGVHTVYERVERRSDAPYALTGRSRSDDAWQARFVQVGRGAQQTIFERVPAR